MRGTGVMCARYGWATVAWLAALSAWGAARARAQEPPRAAGATSGGEVRSKEVSGFYVESFPEFTTGTYGTGTRAETFYLPLTVGYDKHSVVASVSVPFEAIESAGTVTFVEGKPTASTHARRAGAKVTLEDGLGDVLLDAGYFVLEEEPDKRPYLLLEGEVKFPTASHSKGLGTGKYDEALLGTAGMTFLDHWKVEGRIGYGFIGQPGDVPETYRDTVYWDLGAAYAFNPKNELWARLEGNAPAVVSGTTAPVMLLFEYDYLGVRSRFYAEIGFGLTAGAPDFLLALGVRLEF